MRENVLFRVFDMLWSSLLLLLLLPSLLPLLLLVMVVVVTKFTFISHFQTLLIIMCIYFRKIYCTRIRMIFPLSFRLNETLKCSVHLLLA